ncbi:MAG: diheme cytochrome c-553 [Ignavibacteriaceae bacterium]|jgi:hypothetical protein
MKKNLVFAALCTCCFIFLLIELNCSSKMTKEEQIARGQYLANIGGCNDCHSPKIMSAMGPVPDTTRLLSGQSTVLQLPPIDTGMIAMGGWILATGSLNAWVGPWGISFAANLTPDSSTGLGLWTPGIFINAMRTGKHMGAGNAILPPMPWNAIGKLTDEDLNCMFVYLQSIPPIANKVPASVPPDIIAEKFMKK